MSTRYSPSALVAAANKIVEMWTVHPELALGSLTLPGLVKQRSTVLDSSALIAAKRIELSRYITEHQNHLAKLNELVTRARSGIRAAYGDDSLEYKQAGGVRTSERKPRRRASSAT